MSLDRYVYLANTDFHDYEFHRVGSNGKIKKVVADRDKVLVTFLQIERTIICQFCIIFVCID